MDSTTKKADVEWNKDGRPINWNGRDWPLYKRTMMRYLACYEVKENEWRLDDICDGSVTFQSTVSQDEERVFMREDQLLAKLISSSLSCTLARQVMRFDYGSEMWEYLAKRFEGRENATTKLYTQRTLRQKLEAASCRPGADVENHLLYMMSLREQLAALDADVSDVWMVDLMVRSMSQFSYYNQLQTLMLLGGTQTLSTPDEAKSMILILEKNAVVERQLRARHSAETTGHYGTHHGGNGRGDVHGSGGRGDGLDGSGRSGGRGGSGGGSGGGRGTGSGSGKPMPGYQNRNQNNSYKQNGTGGGNNCGYTNYERRSEEEQRIYDDDRANRSCFRCHQPGHIRKNCPNEVKQEMEGSGGNGNGNVRGQANFTVASSVHSHEQQGPALKQENRDVSLAPNPSLKVLKSNQKPVYNAEQWIFDNGANRHLVGDKRYFVNYHELTPEEREKATVYGYNGESSPVGTGSIDLWVSVDGEPVVLRVDNVYYSPKKTNLFSQSVATEQGFQIAYDDETRAYTLSMNGAVAMQIDVQPSKLWIFKAENAFLREKHAAMESPTPTTMINYAISDGVADLQCWHERLGHICPQFVKQMADQDLVEGMMLRNRKFDLCEACQLGKQKAKTPQRNLDRGVKHRNQLVCADLLFPPSHYNCTRFKAILVIMDVHTRFLTAYPVQK
ncbi:unnamed protein product [Phytophthora fragariaefolia]|uniref:Unnamed protein product n=1 Tax=Phytophthora fragariaefolia TaxID=1490495 RepID=A0A9W6X682_9STRA|nr:unnamed protein product [Phytophthora fragariaefolia]